MARVNRPALWTTALLLGLTAVLVGYFSVWLPGPAAGLRLIGVELGEWIKFLGFGPARTTFYAPPILLGLIMVLISASWNNGRWQTWAFRGLAVLVSLIAFPAVAAITMEPRSEWLARILGIAVVVLAALGVPLLARAGSGRWAWWGVLMLSLLGFVVPLWHYAQAQMVVEAFLRRPVGIGLGVWLNSLGFLLISLVAVIVLLGHAKNRSALPPESLN